MCGAAKRGDLQAMAGLLLEAIDSLASAGAVVGLISANTPHMAWSLVEPHASKRGLRLIHIAQPAAERLVALGVRRAGILATSGTLRGGFYQRELASRGIEAVTPPAGDQEALDAAIEALATSSAPARNALSVVRRVASGLQEAGAEAILVACTDISPYTEQLSEEVDVPLVDSSVEHVRAVVEATGAQ